VTRDVRQKVSAMQRPKGQSQALKSFKKTSFGGPLTPLSTDLAACRIIDISFNPIYLAQKLRLEVQAHV
jgi:hypothetical protein